MTAGSLLLWLCFLPSLSSAWCSGGGRWASVASPRHRQSLQELSPNSLSSLLILDKVNHHCNHSKNHAGRRSAVKLWSNISSGGSQQQQLNDDDDDDDGADDLANKKMTLRRASKLLSTFWSMAFPYYQESQPGRRLFIGMIVLTLVNSGVSVAFSYISKDFWNALSSKDTQEFYAMMLKFGGALVVGAPVSVLYR